MGNWYPKAAPGGRVGGRAGLLRPPARDRRCSTSRRCSTRATSASIRTERRRASGSMNVTPSFFPLLRRVAARSAARSPSRKGRSAHEKEAILSYALWQTQFGGDPAAIGRDLRIDGQPYTVVGVMPQSFQFVNPNVLLWRPLAFTDRQKSDDGAPQQQLAEHRAAEAGRDDRAGAGPDRRAQPREPRPLPAVQAAPHQRRVLHEGRAAAGQPGEGHQADAVPDVGRRALRAADRLA